MPHAGKIGPNAALRMVRADLATQRFTSPPAPSPRGEGVKCARH